MGWWRFPNVLAHQGNRMVCKAPYAVLYVVGSVSFTLSMAVPSCFNVVETKRRSVLEWNDAFPEGFWWSPRLAALPLFSAFSSSSSSSSSPPTPTDPTTPSTTSSSSTTAPKASDAVLSSPPATTWQILKNKAIRQTMLVSFGVGGVLEQSFLCFSLGLVWPLVVGVMAQELVEKKFSARIWFLQPLEKEERRRQKEEGRAFPEPPSVLGPQLVALVSRAPKPDLSLPPETIAEIERLRSKPTPVVLITNPTKGNEAENKKQQQPSEKQ